MDWEEVLAYVIKTLLELVTLVVIPYLAVVIKKKIDIATANDYIDDALGVVESAVTFINQTYVNGLKEEGKFDKAAQEKAFSMCKEYVLKLLSEAAKNEIIKSCDDLETWVRVQIESMVLLHK